MFATHATIEVGGREVGLRFMGRGHTDHDILIEIPGTDVVFGGDLVENGNVPFFNDGYPLEWPATLQALAGRVSPDVVLVPGHGDHGGRAFPTLRSRRSRSSPISRDGSRRASWTSTGPSPSIRSRSIPPEDARRGFERALAQARGELDRVETST